MLSHINQAAPRYREITVSRNVVASMRDGVKLLADIYKPETREALPVLLMRTPYNKETAQACVYLDPSWYARQGYMVVVQDCRGRYASEGDWYPFRHEAEDGYDSVEWAGALPGSTGEVGMYGFSYAGALQLLAASLKPRALKTIVPALTASDFFNGWTYEGGALSQAFVQSWALSLAQNTALRAGDLAGAKELGNLLMQLPQFYFSSPLSAVPEILSKYAPYYEDWLRHDSYDDYWRKIAVKERYDSIGVPVLHVGGWYDVFVSGTIKNFMELNFRRHEKGEKNYGKQKLIVGPWYHVPWQSRFAAGDFGPQASNIVNAAQLRWFDYYLRGENYSPEFLEQEVSVFVLGENNWSELNEWPPRHSSPACFYLHSGGRANSLSGDGTLSQSAPGDEPWDSFIFDPAFPVMSLGGHSCCAELIAPMGPCDQRPNQFRNDVLVYTSEPLKDDLCMMGQVSLKLFAASTASDTDFTVTLSDVHDCGKAVNLVNGIIRASRRESLIHPRLLESEAPQEYLIKVGCTAAVIRKGHRIRVELSSSNFPHYSINSNDGRASQNADIADRRTARQTVYHDSLRPSHLLLPLCPMN